MDRKEAYEIMKRGSYITHPILIEGNAGPLFLNGNTIYGKNNEPLKPKWKEQLHSHRFCSGWIECDKDGNPLNICK
ncbi:MAG: hypothetical protein IJ376_02835 [Acidaminococcaceae bacterium]|nr:hypothetical protein [Acidaminococcaceae bacterium]